jgi:hypothetical protein
MARQVEVKPSKVANRLSHQGLINLIVRESLKKKDVDWNFFLFWNKFHTDLQPNNKGKKPTTKKSLTPKSSRRKRRDISPPHTETETSSIKPKRDKRKLDFGKKGEQTEGLNEENNPLNLPYSDSEEDREKTEIQGDEQAKSFLFL